MINAVSVMLGQQPGPPDAKTSGVSDTVHALFTKLGIARNKQKYHELLAELAAQHPEQFDPKLVGRNDVSSLSFDNLEFMMKWVDFGHSSHSLLRSLPPSSRCSPRFRPPPIV